MYLAVCGLMLLILIPVEDLDGAILFQYTAADNKLGQSAMQQHEHEGAHTWGPPHTANTGSRPGRV